MLLQFFNQGNIIRFIYTAFWFQCVCSSNAAAVSIAEFCIAATISSASPSQKTSMVLSFNCSTISGTKK